MRRPFIILLSILFLGGCDAYGPEELDRLTKEDPQFNQMIVQRDQAHRQIDLIKQDLLSRKNAMDAQILKLRQAYDTYAKAQHEKIEQYKIGIEANRRSLQKDIDAAQAQLSLHQIKCDDLEKTQREIQKVLENKSIKLTAPEREKWQERYLMYSEKIRPLLDDINELKLEIRLKKQKISFLR